MPRPHSHHAILPGAVIGVFGSGQLGRMMALAARAMGYRIHCYSPDHNSPTGQVADRELTGSYTDLDAVRSFVAGVDVLTFEFENVATAVAEIADAEGVPVRPSGHVLHIAQHRLREKRFLAAAGLPVTPFYAVRHADDLSAGLAQLGLPAVLKTAAFGYDGKGQARIDAGSQAAAAWAALGAQECILETFVPYSHELSVIAARGLDGQIVDYGAIENQHRNHILDLAISPARIPHAIAAEAVRIAHAVLAALDVVGVLCVEFFLTQDGRLLINELAPRPHNSGHLTVDAAVTSQFEQQVRAICSLPLGATDRMSPAVMANLLGDLWVAGPPDWVAALSVPHVKLHLYGKAEPRPGRKMGHLTALAPTVEDALLTVQSARRALQPHALAE